MASPISDNSGGVEPRTIPIVVLIVLTVLSVVALGWGLVTYAVGAGYHANSIGGHVGTRYFWAFFSAILLNLGFAFWAVRRNSAPGKLGRALRAVGIFIALVVLYLVLARVPMSHYVVYFIGNQKYSIPWEFNPINGRAQPGGEYFVIHVSFPGMEGQYVAENYRQRALTISKWLGTPRPGRQSIDELCGTENPCAPLKSPTNVYFVDGDYWYGIHYQGRPDISFDSRDDLIHFEQTIVELFDSFRDPSGQ